MYRRRVRHETIRPSLWTWGLCLILVSAVLGHVCVLPAHSHALPARHADHDHHDHADHAVHEASCQAIATSSSPGTILAPTPADMSIAERPAVEPLRVATAAIRQLPAVKTRRGPPLFLLHASLLI